MKIRHAFISTALIATTLIHPVFAADDTDITPVAERVHSRIAYGTPTIDGYLDSAYAQSERIDYKLQPFYLWVYPGSPTEENAKKYISWDTGVEAYSYILWDDENLYVYTAVKDNSSGIVDFNKVNHDPPYPDVYSYQDGVKFSLAIDSNWITAFSERGGRFFGLTRGNTEYTSLKYLSTDRSKVIGTNSDCFATADNDNSYVTEFKIPLTEKGAQVLRLGAKIHQTININNFIDTLNYGHWSITDDIHTEPGFDNGVFYGEHIYDTKYDYNTISYINRYMDLVGTSKGDVNCDSYTDSRDLVRLMKNIAENIVTEPTSDVNLDGEVDVRDLVALMKKISLG